MAVRGAMELRTSPLSAMESVGVLVDREVKKISIII